VTATTDQIDAARKAGYSDDEIYDHLTQAHPGFATARQQGYTLDEIGAHYDTQAALPTMIPAIAARQDAPKTRPTGLQGVSTLTGQPVSGATDLGVGGGKEMNVEAQGATPLVTIPKIQRDPNVLDKSSGAGADVINGITGAVNSMTAPKNIGLTLSIPAVAAMSPVAASAVALGFLGYTAEQFPKQFEDTMAEQDPQKRREGLGALGLNTVSAILAGVHVAKPGVLEDLGQQVKNLQDSGLPEAAKAHAAKKVKQIVQQSGDLKPALMVNGKPEVALPGETHAQIADRLNAPHPVGAPERTPVLEAVTDDSKHVFVDPNGNVLNRTEGANALLNSGRITPEEHAAMLARSDSPGLHSEDLNALNQKATDEKTTTATTKTQADDAGGKSPDGDGVPPGAGGGSGGQPAAAGQAAETPPVGETTTPLSARGRMLAKAFQARGVRPDIAEHFARQADAKYGDLPTEELRESAFKDFEADVVNWLNAVRFDQSKKRYARNKTSNPQPPSSAPTEAAGPAATKPTGAAGTSRASPAGGPSEAASASDWTSATDRPTTKLRRPSGKGGQSGAINLSVLSDAAKAAREMAEKLLGAAGTFTPLNVATGEHIAALQKSFQEATRAQKAIALAVPNARRQSAISVWREAGGDTAKLQQWEQQAKGKAFKDAAKLAQNLTPKEIAIAQKAAKAFDVLSARGQQYDVLGSHRDNYIPHVWDVDNKATGIGTSRLQDQFKFAKARTFDTFFDGDQAGFKPKTMEIGKLLPSYIHEMNKVIADRQFIQDVSDLKGSDGRPLVIPRGTGQTLGEGENTTAIVNPRGWVKQKGPEGEEIDQHDYKMLGDQPALNKWHWVESDPNGNPTILKGDLAVHPELAKRLNAMMGQSELRRWYNEAGTGLSVIPRAIVKNLDTAQSVMKREMFSLLAPFHQVQEGTHAIGHLVNPFNVAAPDLRDAGTMDAVKHGLRLMPDRTSSQNYMEGLGGQGGFVAQAARKFGGKAGTAIANVVDGYQDYLFHNYIPGLKMETYNHILPRNMARFAAELKSGEVTEADVKFLTATQTNAAYGNLNYAMMDRNPTMQHFFQIAALAPDFLEARGRFVGQALKSFVGVKGGNEQLRAIATIAAVQAASAYIITTLTGGKYDPKQPFSVQHGDRSYTMRSIPSDLQRLAFSGEEERHEFISARVNPLVQKAYQLATGINYRGEKVTDADTIVETLANYIPITARWIPGLNQLTETTRNSPISPMEQLAGSLAVQIHRNSPITKVYEMADKYMAAKGIPKQEGIYATSKYQPLRYALEDADMQRAAREYKKLMTFRGNTPEKVAKGLYDSVNHPFTGTKESDAEFAASLKGDDKLIYDNAIKVKQGILQKFALIPGIQVTEPEKLVKLKAFR